MEDIFYDRVDKIRLEVKSDIEKCKTNLSNDISDVKNEVSQLGDRFNDKFDKLIEAISEYKIPINELKIEVEANKEISLMRYNELTAKVSQISDDFERYKLLSSKEKNELEYRLVGLENTFGNIFKKLMRKIPYIKNMF